MSRHNGNEFEAITSNIPKDHNMDKVINKKIARMER
jgi:hypothetical protein